MRSNIGDTKIKSATVLLSLSFCALVLVKAILSLKFQSPWLLPDEVSYAKMAGDIFGSVYSGLPRGYPFILSITYLFSKDMMVVYHLMLVVNSFISSLIIFPSYFILNKYCSKDFSFAGAIIIATLPSLTHYTFLITTENLFVPLFVFSIWFLLEAYEKEEPFWIVLAITSTSLLLFTRHTGIFMIAAMAVSLAYYLLSGKRSNAVRGIVLSKRTYIFLFLFIVLLGLFGLALTGSDRSSYFNWLIDRARADSQVFLSLFLDINHLKSYLVLLQNEIGYLIIASYFIFTYLAIRLFSGLFLASVKQIGASSISSWFDSLGREKMQALRSVSIYYLLTSAILVFTTTLSVYQLQQELIGRYIDPIIPGLFLFGFIGLYHMHEAPQKRDSRAFTMLAIFAVVFSLLFFFSFPILTPNIVTIYYINFLKSIAPNWIIFPAFAAGSFLLLNSYKNWGANRTIFFTTLIIFSVCICAYTYNADLVLHSKTNYDQNQIGDYLSIHGTKDMRVVMDDSVAQNDWYFVAMTRFWMKGEVTYQPITGNLSDMKGYTNETYLITSKVLPLEPLAVSTRGYYLYKYHLEFINKTA